MSDRQTVRSICRATVAAIAILAIAPVPAHAISAAQRNAQLAGIATQTFVGTLTPAQEVVAAAAVWVAYYAEHPPILFPFVGQTLVGGSFPVTTSFTGETENLSFEYIDASTLMPTTGPVIAAVRYEVNTDPTTPGVFSFVGNSNNGANNFAVPYTFGAGDATIYATPFDLAGNPITVVDIDGVGNVAQGLAFDVGVPEPSTWAMMLAGFAVIGFNLRRRIGMQARAV